jgi:hypothetical protein
MRGRNGDGFIELRVAYPTRARLFRIDGLDSRSCNLSRFEIGDYLDYRREYLTGGGAVAVYGLPLYDAVYEVRQIIDGRRASRFFAVCRGALHRITRDAVEAISEGSMTLQQWSQTDDDDGYEDVL